MDASRASLVADELEGVPRPELASTVRCPPGMSARRRTSTSSRPSARSERAPRERNVQAESSQSQNSFSRFRPVAWRWPNRAAGWGGGGTARFTPPFSRSYPAVRGARRRAPAASAGIEGRSPVDDRSKLGRSCADRLVEAHLVDDLLELTRSSARASTPPLPRSSNPRRPGDELQRRRPA